MKNVPYRYKDVKVRTADETVVMAAQIADQYSRDTAIRELAARITDGLVRVDVSGPERIAKWVRMHIRYRQETPGVEILQGPYTTLKSRVGDCDDLVILWMCLCRSIGINAMFCGARYIGDEDYLHAIGYLPEHRVFYELTDDRAYGGKKTKIIQPLMPSGVEAVYHDLDQSGLQRAQGGGSIEGSALRWIDKPGAVVVAIAVVVGALLWGTD